MTHTSLNAVVSAGPACACVAEDVLDDGSDDQDMDTSSRSDDELTPWETAEDAPSSSGESGKSGSDAESTDTFDKADFEKLAEEVD